MRRLAQIGLTARVVIYGVMAVLCWLLATGHPSPQADAQGAFQEIHRQPGGTAMLVVVSCCLAAMVLWRLHQAAFGSARDHRAALPRVGALAIAVVYGLLLADVVKLLASGTSTNSSAKTASLTATVLRWPGGPALLALAAVLLGIAGVAFVVWGATRDLDKVLQRQRLSHAWWRFARWSSIIGDAGRGAVACLLAGALFSAAVDGQPAAAKSIGQLLEALRHVALGPAVIALIGTAFLAYCGFSLIELVAGRF